MDLGHGVLQKTPESNVRLFVENSERDFRINLMKLNSELLKKYNVPGPRYTSYPTVPYWSENPDGGQWIASVGQALDEAKETRNRCRALYPYSILRVALHLLWMQYADHSQSCGRKSLCPDAFSRSGSFTLHAWSRDLDLGAASGRRNSDLSSAGRACEL